MWLKTVNTYDHKIFELRVEPGITANTTPNKVTVALIQTKVSENMAKNIQKTQRRVEEAAHGGAQIICLQELYRTRYFPQEEHRDVADLAESIPGESTDALGKLAKQHSVVIIAPLFEKGKNGKFYNSAAVIGADGQVIGVYRKIHIPYDPYFFEKNYFAQGTDPYRVYDVGCAKIGVLICYDQWFPEPARINSLQGAEIIFYPTAIGYVKGYNSADGDWHEAWRTVQKAHAITNGVHVAAVNRVGEEDELEFWGSSFVCDAFGKVVAEASNQTEQTLIVTIDLSKNKQIQEGWGFLRNRRPDTYLKLTEKLRGASDE